MFGEKVVGSCDGPGRDMHAYSKPMELNQANESPWTWGKTVSFM